MLQDTVKTTGNQHIDSHLCQVCLLPFRLHLCEPEQQALIAQAEERELFLQGAQVTFLRGCLCWISPPGIEEKGCDKQMVSGDSCVTWTQRGSLVKGFLALCCEHGLHRAE